MDTRESEDMISADRSQAFHRGDSPNVDRGEGGGPWGQGVGAAGDDVEVVLASLET